MDLIPSTYLDEMITVAILQILAVISPGPDFAIVIKNSLLHSRKVGLYTAVGIAVGVLFHIALAVFGIGLALTQSPLIFTSFKIVASCYLLYIAYTSFFATKSNPTKITETTQAASITTWQAFHTGVITNVMNPKCILFMLTLFTAVVSSTTPRAILATYGALIFLITLIWFVFLALCFSNKKVQHSFSNLTHWITRFTGLVFAFIAAHILYDLVF